MTNSAHLISLSRVQLDNPPTRGTECRSRPDEILDYGSQQRCVGDDVLRRRPHYQPLRRWSIWGVRVHLCVSLLHYLCNGELRNSFYHATALLKLSRLPGLSSSELCWIWEAVRTTTGLDSGTGRTQVRLSSSTTSQERRDVSLVGSLCWNSLRSPSLGPRSSLYVSHPSS